MAKPKHLPYVRKQVRVNPVEFAAEVEAMRVRMGFGQMDLAYQLGLTGGTINDILCGHKQIISRRTAKRIQRLWEANQPPDTHPEFDQVPADPESNLSSEASSEQNAESMDVSRDSGQVG